MVEPPNVYEKLKKQQQQQNISKECQRKIMPYRIQVLTALTVGQQPLCRKLKICINVTRMQGFNK